MRSPRTTRQALSNRIQAKRLCLGQVDRILHARVPILKFRDLSGGPLGCWESETALCAVACRASQGSGQLRRQRRQTEQLSGNIGMGLVCSPASHWRLQRACRACCDC